MRACCAAVCALVLAAPGIDPGALEVELERRLARPDAGADAGPPERGRPPLEPVELPRAAELSALVQEALTEKDPAKAKIKEAVGEKLRVVQASMAKMSEHLKKMNQRRSMMEATMQTMSAASDSQEKETERQTRMYNAVALEQNKLESYQHSLTESMRKAQDMTAAVSKNTHEIQASMNKQRKGEDVTIAMILEYMEMKNGTEANDYLDDGSFNTLLIAPYQGLFFTSEAISAQANEGFRILEDCKLRARNVEKELMKARAVMNRLTEHWTYRHIGEEAKEEEKEKVDEEKKARATKLDLTDEYGGLKISGAMRPTMLLEENATVNASGDASSFLETNGTETFSALDEIGQAPARVLADTGLPE